MTKRLDGVWGRLRKHLLGGLAPMKCLLTTSQEFYMRTRIRGSYMKARF